MTGRAHAPAGATLYSSGACIAGRRLVAAACSLGRAVSALLLLAVAGAAFGQTSATFVQLDATTRGSWNGNYGQDGYFIPTIGASNPAYGSVSANGISGAWTGSSSDVRALERPGIPGPDNRVAPYTYSNTQVDVTVTVNGSDARRVSLYFLDWEYSGRAVRVDVRDARTNALLDSRSLPSYGGGAYLTWEVRGSVRFEAVRTAGANVVVTGVFFGGTGAPPPPVGPFQNGSFELGAFNPGANTALPPDSTVITGWTAIGGIDYIGSLWTASQGSRSVDLIGAAFAGGIQQTFATTPGATYDVLFDLAGNPGGGPAIKPLTVSAAGTSQSYTFDTTGRTLTAMGWVTRTFTFTATGSEATLAFVSDGTGSNCCYGAAIDNVRLIEVSGGGPGSFNAFDTGTAGGSVTGTIQTKVAGADFSLAVVALNVARSALNTSYTGTATVQLLDARDSVGALDANGCRASWTAIAGASTSVTFTAGNNGRVNATLNVAGAWPDVRVRIMHGSNTGCSNDNFAIRPAALVVSASDLDWQSPFTGTGTPRALTNAAASGGVVHAAGAPFTLTATGVGAGGAATPGYTGSPTVLAGGVACVLPAGCSTGALAIPAWSAAGPGEVRATAVTYAEVGTFSVQLEDVAFAAVDALDTPLEQRRIPHAAALTVGRFVPAYYDLQPSGAAPLLRTMNTADLACSAPPPATPRRSFTYVGQPFGFAVRPQATILPRNAAGQLTANYRGNLWKLGTAQIARTLDASATTPAGQPVVAVVGALLPADVASNGDGTGTVIGSALDTITYTRNPAAPTAPFTAAIASQTQVVDNTEAGPAGNPASIPTTGIACFNGGGSCAAPAGGIAFDSAAGGFPGNAFRYGRLRLANANGSELIALPLPLRAEYWNGSAWVPNTLDFCSSVSVPNLALSNYQRNLAAGETTPAIAGPLAAGSRSIVFSAPGAGNAGSVDLTLDLSPAGANLPWLQGAWTGTTFNQNPAARATFGTAARPSPVIFRRERF